MVDTQFGLVRRLVTAAFRFRTQYALSPKLTVAVSALFTGMGTSLPKSHSGNPLGTRDVSYARLNSDSGGTGRYSLISVCVDS